jgi:2'-hydroxyisoflavone reductase
VLRACLKAAGDETGVGDGEVRITHADEGFLRSDLSGVPEEERPLWFPEDQIPFEAVDSSRALAAGLRFRSAEETARDTLAWVRSRPQDVGLRAGFSPAFEDEVLGRWHGRMVRSV